MLIFVDSHREWKFVVALYDSSRVGIEFAKLPRFNIANKAGKEFMLMTADEWFLLSKSEQKSVLQKMEKGGWLVRVSWNPATKESLRRAMEEVEDAQQSLVAASSNVVTAERRLEAVMESIDRLVCLG